MSSDIDIANFALTRLGAGRIVAFTDNTKQARSITAIYAMVRDAEVGDHNWSFAAKRVQLATLPDVPAFGYSFTYELPDDCLCVVRVGDQWPGRDNRDYRDSPDSDYRIEQRKILTNLNAPLSLLYNSRVTDASQFDPLFVEALGYRLAMELCEEITGSNAKLQLLEAGYEKAISRAIANDSIQEPPDFIADDSWVLSRL